MEDEGSVADHLSGVASTDGRWHHVAVRPLPPHALPTGAGAARTAAAPLTVGPIPHAQPRLARAVLSARAPSSPCLSPA